MTTSSKSGQFKAGKTIMEDKIRNEMKEWKMKEENEIIRLLKNYCGERFYHEAKQGQYVKKRKEWYFVSGRENYEIPIHRNLIIYYSRHTCR